MNTKEKVKEYMAVKNPKNSFYILDDTIDELQEVAILKKVSERVFRVNHKEIAYFVQYKNVRIYRDTDAELDETVDNYLVVIE